MRDLPQLARTLELDTIQPLLEGTWHKLVRARMHKNEVQRMVDDYSKRQLARVGYHVDADTQATVLRLADALEEPPSALNSAIGDVLFDMRSALDHLMWALVSVSGGDPGRNTQFPIFESAEKFNERRDVWDGVTTVVKRALLEEQPFHPKRGGRLLAYLDELHNVDKHRHLNLVAAYHAGSFPDPPHIMAYRAIAEEIARHIGPVQPWSVLARIPREYASIRWTPTFEFQFGEGTGARGERVLGVLGALDDNIFQMVEQYQRKFFDR